MTKRMLIDAEYLDETRVVITNDDEIKDFDHETARKKQNRGNLYLAKIARVEPSLQAAFVDYGNEKHGFLAFSEIHPDYFQIPIADKEILLRDANENNNIENTDIDEDNNDIDKKVYKSNIKSIQKYKIQEVIKKGQIILIQVTKEERGNKGAALTTFISLAGRYCVLMPNTIRKGGISRRITNINDRKKLRSIIEGLKIKKSMAIIIRTAGSKRNKLEIKRDFTALSKSWEKIKEITLKSVAPVLVHEENNIIKRAIRDLYDADVTEILVEGTNSFKEAKSFMKTLIPSQVKKIKQYKEKSPLLQKFNIDKKLEKIHSPVASLPSGGYLVINQTEALVAVDVNSGRATKERNIEQTALQTNKEAAEELAIQLRLRDLSGLIVVDFIDMMISRNNRVIENILKQSMHSDRAKVQVGSISSFGLLEMSRQRLRPSIYEADFAKCDHCDGTGTVRSIESLTLKALRDIEEMVSLYKKEKNIKIDMPKDTAIHILNNKRKEISTIENKRNINITIVPNNDLNEFDKAKLTEKIDITISEDIPKKQGKIKRNYKLKKDDSRKKNINKMDQKSKKVENKSTTDNIKYTEPVIKSENIDTEKNKKFKKPSKNIKQNKILKPSVNLKTSNTEDTSKLKKTVKKEKVKKKINEKKSIPRKKGPKRTGWWSKDPV